MLDLQRSATSSWPRAAVSSRNSACASSISTLSRARARGLTSNDPRALRHFMSHNYCPSVPILRYLRPAKRIPVRSPSPRRVFLRLCRAYAHNARTRDPASRNNSVSWKLFRGEAAAAVAGTDHREWISRGDLATRRERRALYGEPRSNERLYTEKNHLATVAKIF